MPESTSTPTSSSSSSNTRSEGTTELVHGIDNVIKTELQFFSNATKRIDTCMNYTRPELAIALEPIRKAFLDAKARNVRLTYITEITKDNISYCKELMTLVDELRHLEGIKGNFMLSETEYISPVILFEKGKVASQIVYSNLEQIVEQQQYFFDTLWGKAIPAKDRIYELENGIEESPFIKTFRDPVEIQTTAFNHIRSAVEEILTIFSTANAFYRQIVIAGGRKLFREAISERNVKIRILTPKNSRIDKIVQELLEEQQPQEEEHEEKEEQRQVEQIKQQQQRQRQRRIEVRYIEPARQTKTSVLIIDKKFCMSVEVKDDTKDNSYEAMGLATYSNSIPTVLSYVSIFESLWTQTELNEQLKTHNKMQKDFIDVAAHELRTPIQPILGLSQVLRSKIKNSMEHQELLDAIVRNAKRLQDLTENILDVTRIESNALFLNKIQFNLREVILNAIADCKSQRREYDNIRLELISKEDIFVEADKTRIGQVIFNLLNNAIKFTQGKKDEDRVIIISVTLKEHKNDDGGDDHGKEVIVSIKDAGIGIASEIMPILFTKFAARSDKGTGLGLFISKNIVESHGGRIWAENNKDGRGATFSFSLPVIKNNK
ncbi:MAG TPA: HAMP domain-containing sensor histidine kinase [Nitrososphaeraceae archaeon]|nr:HAMP domain-containing sensor histidine kinase [Nitrososphaeraceae archaeon]